MQYNSTEVLIHVGNSDTGAIKSFRKIKLNAAAGRTFQWLPNSKGLLCLTIPAGRGKPPAPARAPAGPVVQETGPKEAAVLTYPDLLQNEHDEKLFNYYLTAQLTTVDIKTSRSRNLGRPSIFGRFDVSPDGRYVLVERVHPPYSYQSPAQFFPRSIEVWDLKAEVKHVSIRPATEDVATGEVPVQPRGHHWRPTGPATIAWIEAHIALSVLTYGILTLAAVAGVAVFLQERAMKNKRPTRLTAQACWWRKPMLGGKARFLWGV